MAFKAAISRVALVYIPGGVLCTRETRERSPEFQRFENKKREVVGSHTVHLVEKIDDVVESRVNLSSTVSIGHCTSRTLRRLDNRQTAEVTCVFSWPCVCLTSTNPALRNKSTTNKNDVNTRTKALLRLHSGNGRSC